MIRTLLLCVVIVSSNAHAKTIPSTNFKSVQEFIDRMVNEHSFSKRELNIIFSTVELVVPEKPSAIKKPKKEAKLVPKKKPISWDKYRGLFVNNNRIQDGIKFWKSHHNTIQKAEKEYSIPSEIIVAVLGIETNYGQTKGKHPTFEALTKRSFGNYRRKKFYKDELESFLLMVRENSIPPLSIKGSYAGAMGYPQFISSSYRYYAVDFNLDGKIDLFSNPIDSIGSIANYFSKHYWQDGADIATQIELKREHESLAKRSINKPKKVAKFWRDKGIDMSNTIADDTKIAFILLEQDEASNNETWLTFWNFYVLTRYNHDNRYAMAVHQLANKIKQGFNSLK